MPDHLPENIQALLMKQSSTSLLAEEQQQLDDWYESLAFMPAGNLLDGGERETVEQEMIWAEVRARMSVTASVKVVKMFRWWKKVAAAVVIAAIAGGTWYTIGLLNRPYKLQLATSTGNVRQLTLPDGSRVWLNASSRLQYNNWQPGKSREVMLDGEAFFDVAQRAGEPFIIHTTAMDINVLGTSLNVKAYASDATAEATLVTGKVAIVLKNEKNRTVQLAPSQKLVTLSSPEHREVEKIKSVKQHNITDTANYSIAPARMFTADSSYAEVAWKEHRLAFFDQPFETIAQQLQRWYGVNVVFNNEAIKTIRFTGTFRDESLSRVIMALQLSAPFNYHISNDTLMIDK